MLGLALMIHERVVAKQKTCLFLLLVFLNENKHIYKIHIIQSKFEYIKALHFDLSVDY